MENNINKKVQKCGVINKETVRKKFKSGLYINTIK